MDNIAVEIMTPERLVMQTQADSVIVPATEGELGILPHHTPLLAQLQPGQIRLRRGNDLELFAVSGGFVQVEANKVSIFAETAEMPHEIDVERARQAADRAREQMKVARSDVDLAQAEFALRRALARLHATEGLARVHKKPHLE
jgi:F-type H+-transporting ATPase subunit epsilon